MSQNKSMISPGLGSGSEYQPDPESRCHLRFLRDQTQLHLGLGLDLIHNHLRPEVQPDTGSCTAPIRILFGKRVGFGSVDNRCSAFVLKEAGVLVEVVALAGEEEVVGVAFSVSGC